MGDNPHSPRLRVSGFIYFLFLQDAVEVNWLPLLLVGGLSALGFAGVLVITGYVDVDFKTTATKALVDRPVSFWPGHSGSD